jgi:hypothetical protein
MSRAIVTGEHSRGGSLPSTDVELAHRSVMDPGRLGHTWQQGLLAEGLNEEKYVEAVGIIAHTVNLDTFALALGLPERPCWNQWRASPAVTAPPA